MEPLAVPGLGGKIACFVAVPLLCQLNYGIEQGLLGDDVLATFFSCLSSFGAHFIEDFGKHTGGFCPVRVGLTAGLFPVRVGLSVGFIPRRFCLTERFFA